MDAVSDDGRYALTVIAFVGSVFSPRYYAARQKAPEGLVNPEEYCTLNVALHGPDGVESWVFTEFNRVDVFRSPTTFRLGSNQLVQSDDGLSIDLDAKTKPFFQRMVPRIKGRIRLDRFSNDSPIVSLDTLERHRWIGLSPRARVHVELESPEISFSGHAYHDANHGLEPLENGFQYWNWSRAELNQGTVVIYDTVDKYGVYSESARLFHNQGSIRDVNLSDSNSLKSGSWGVQRKTRLDQGAQAEVVKTLVDAPFYTRSILNTQLMGQRCTAVHESVDLRRFSASWVRFLLPWKIRQDS